MTRLPTMVLCALAPALAAAAPCAAQRPAPWLATEVRGLRDSQPRSLLQIHAELGRYVTDDIGGMLLLDAQHTGADAVSSSTAAPGAAAIISVPALRLGVVAGGQALLGARGSDVLVWHARAALRLPADVQLRARAERTHYTATAASIDTLVLVRTDEILLDRSAAPGWAAAAAARREEYGDDNPVRTLYAWLLAPLSRSASRALRAGYAVAWQDAEESRWRTAPEQRPPRGPFATPGAILPGAYDPYYTPHDQLVHSLIADAALAAGEAWLTLSASAGVHARELAPQRSSAGPQAADGTLHFVERSYTPWRITASWWTPLDAAAALTIEAEYSSSAYYDAARVRIGVTRTLRPR